MLIRNIDVQNGLCNGTRLQIVATTEYNLLCKILTGPRAGKEVLLPKVKFEHGTGKNHRGMRFSRLQFPLRLCFAMTINKVFF